MPSVTLRTAYAYDCEDCGRENFVRAVIAEMSPEDQAWLRTEHGVEECATGDFVMMPESVTCGFCGAVFEAKDEREGE